MTEKDSRYAEFFMKTAILASELSFAKRSKVGAVLVKDGRILVTGFNGTPHSCSNQCEDILPDRTLVTRPNVVHAEANIISFADSCRVGNHHTQSHFENIMRDYSDYEHYCKKHDIPNHFIDSEYKYIEKVYQECLEEDKFI